MKPIYIKSFLCLLFLMTGLAAHAYDCEVGGIYYNLNTSDKTATVTYKTISGNSYSGSVNIPESITYNGNSYSVTYIGYNAFYDCTDLTSVIIPNSVTEIDGLAFYGCKGLTSITIPNSVTEIGGRAFDSCTGLSSITIPNCVTEIGTAAFYGCSGLTSVSIGNGVTSIGESAFRNCSGLTSVSIGNGVTSIGESAFQNCSGLTSITIPNSVTEIGSFAFYGCTGLTSITIPNSVTSIVGYAFYGCSGLKDVYSQIENPFEINSNVFSKFDTATLYVPLGTKALYEATPAWNQFAKIVDYDYSTAVEEIMTDSDAVPKEFYSVDGTRLDRPQRGINIIHMSDGTTRKVFVK